MGAPNQRAGERVAALLDTFIPAGLDGETKLRHARVLIATALMGTFAALLPSVIRWLVGMKFAEGIQQAIAFFAFFSTPLILRWTRSVTAAGTYMLAWSLVLTTYVALGYTGLEYAVMGWFTVIALVAVFFLGRRRGVAIAGFSMVAVATVYALTSLDSDPIRSLMPPVLLEQVDPAQGRLLAMLNVELSIALATVMALVYDRELRRESSDLERRERDFRRLTDTLAVGVFVTRGGRILHGNATGAALLGVSLKELPGLDFTDAIELDRGRSELRSSTDTASARETAFAGRDGVERVVDLASMPIRWDGTSATLHTAFDLTERKWEARERARLEAQVRHTQKLETIGLLAGGIAHDFNNILQTILANTEMLQGTSVKAARGDATKANGADDRRLDRIQIAAKRGAELVEQMLAYAGRGHARIEDLEISELVDEVVQLASAAISKKTQVDLDLATSLPMVSADPTQIRQVVMNLVTNASDAVGDQVGRVAVRTGVIELAQLEQRATFVAGDLAPGQYVFIEVEDDGCGIEETQVSKIFDPFFTTKSRGRGLGLAAVLGIVRAHGGNLEVRTALGEGTLFRIFLPAVAGVERRPRSASEGIGTAIRNARVLVADDEPAILESSCESLRDRGFTVTGVSDGAAAVAAVRERPTGYDVVILDMAMPRMDGAEAIAEIHEFAPSLPAILSTGYAHGHEQTDLMQLGFAEILHKPYRERDLIRALDRVLGAEADHPRVP